MTTQTRLAGKTGGGWIRAASLAQSSAGGWHVWVEVRGESMQVLLTDDGHAAIHGVAGLRALLKLSPRARQKLEELEAVADRRMREAING